MVQLKGLQTKINITSTIFGSVRSHILTMYQICLSHILCHLISHRKILLKTRLSWIRCRYDMWMLTVQVQMLGVECE